MKRALSSAALIMTFIVLMPGVSAAAQNIVGIVRNLTGEATITRGDQIFPAAVGTRLVEADTLMTGSNGSMGVILRDNSTLSLGPGSSLTVRSFRFSPVEG